MVQESVVGFNDLVGSSLVVEIRPRVNDCSFVRFVTVKLGPGCGTSQSNTDSLGSAKVVTFQQKEGWIGVCQVDRTV